VVSLVRCVAAGAGVLADRLERALADEVKLLALTIEERAIILGQLEDPPDGLAALRAVLLNEHQWRQREGRLGAAPTRRGWRCSSRGRRYRSSVLTRPFGNRRTEER
jgi:hypothetical protein